MRRLTYQIWGRSRIKTMWVGFSSRLFLNGSPFRDSGMKQEGKTVRKHTHTFVAPEIASQLDCFKKNS